MSQARSLVETEGHRRAILRSLCLHLNAQQEIVAEVESYQKVIDGARAVIDNYRPHIPLDPEWPIVRVDALCELGR